MSEVAHRLAALGERIELGMRVLKTGKLAGQTVRWGKDLPARMPWGYTGDGVRTGTYQIVDPATKMTTTVQRAAAKSGEPAEGWAKKRLAYIANINLPKKYRGTREGTLAGLRQTGGLLGHFDLKGVNRTVRPNAKGIGATTVAGAYERKTIDGKLEGTHDLVRAYQSRGFRIDGNAASVPNEWNVPMYRPAGAKPVTPASRGRFEGYMVRQRRRHEENAHNILREHLSVLKPAASTVAGAAALGGTGVLAKTDNPHQDTAQKVLVPGMLAGGVIGGIKARNTFRSLRANAGDIKDYSIVAANQGRVRIGKAWSKAGAGRIKNFLGRQLLRGVA